jgi:hypothetical protein
MFFYQKPFKIFEAVSNNAFNFSRRKSPLLHVPALKEGTFTDVTVGTETVFEDFDEHDVLHSCRGLENFIRTSSGQTPVYIFDNHNHAFFFWCYEFQQQTFQKGATLIHIDQHKDNRIPESFLSEQEIENLEKVFQYTNKVLNVGNFIPPAVKAGLVERVIFLDSEYSLSQFDLNELPSGDILLDIDLDFFAPEFDYIPHRLKMEVLRKLVPKASMVTLATSPFFIDQELALKYLGEIGGNF